MDCSVNYWLEIIVYALIRYSGRFHGIWWKIEHGMKCFGETGANRLAGLQGHKNRLAGFGRVPRAFHFLNFCHFDASDGCFPISRVRITH